MYLVWSHGHGTSACPGYSGAPTECRQRTKSAPSPSFCHTGAPERVMICMETATYAESVTCTPYLGSAASRGPMQNAITYMMRPTIAPRYSSVITVFMSTGSIQLLVGPASDCSCEQMKVRSSTRATSSGSEADQNEFCLRFSCTKVPVFTRSVVRRRHSSSLPSHHTTSSGVVSSATLSTQSMIAACVVGVVRPDTAGIVMRSPCKGWLSRFGPAVAARVAGAWVSSVLVREGLRHVAGDRGDQQRLVQLRQELVGGGEEGDHVGRGDQVFDV